MGIYGTFFKDTAYRFTGELDIRNKRRRGVNNNSKLEKNYNIIQWGQIFKKKPINSYRALKTTTTTKRDKKVFGNAGGRSL